MIKAAIEKILELATPKLLEIDGRQYSSAAIQPVHDPGQSPIIVHTLDGFLEYLISECDRPSYTPIICVANHTEVEAFSQVWGNFKQRDRYITAQLISGQNFQFGRYQTLEEFNVGLQAFFVQDETTHKILHLISNLKDEKVATFEDDGISQSVKAKVGIARVEQVPVPNPVILRPYRTFLEIKQPTSPFIFRLKSGSKEGEAPLAALFEAGGGAWKMEAIDSIAAYVRAKCPIGWTILA